MVDQYLLKKNTEEEIMKRNRKFLSNLTFAEKVEEKTIKREDYKEE